MVKLFKIIGITIIFIFASFCLSFSQEQITITTYYPSPFGSYKELRAQRMAIGDAYINNATVCWENCPVGVTPVPAATDLVVEGNVGIGTITPQAKLQTDGSIISTAYQGLTSNFFPGIEIGYSGDVAEGYRRGIIRVRTDYPALEGLLIDAPRLEISTQRPSSGVDANVVVTNRGHVLIADPSYGTLGIDTHHPLKVVHPGWECTNPSDNPSNCVGGSRHTATFIDTNGVGIAIGGLRMDTDWPPDNRPNVTIASIQAFDESPFSVQNLILQRGGGNVGIGTRTPGARLHVVDEWSTVTLGQGVITAEDSTVPNPFAANGGAGIALRGVYKTDGTTAGFGGIKAGKTNATSGNLDSYLAFYSRNNTDEILERMRINQDGNVGIGTNNPLSRLVVTSDPLNSGAPDTGITVDAPGATANEFAFFARASTGSHTVNNLFVIRGDGNVGIGTTNPSYKLQVVPNPANPTIYGYVRATDGAWVGTSDIRNKKNITTLKNVLEKILKIRAVRYDMKSEPDSKGKGRHIGFIAQELEKEFPEFVDTGSDGYKSVSYASMTSVLVEAIKEQQKQIDKLKSELKDLKARFQK